MPVPPRQAVPSLLQVDAILGHLSGVAALDEVCRFLGAELPQFATLAIYRPDGSSFQRLTNADALADGTESLPAEGALARVLAEGRTAVTVGGAGPVADAPSEVAVPIVSAGRLTAVLYAASRLGGAFDPTDGRFLEQVAGKVRSAVDVARGADPAPAA